MLDFSTLVPYYAETLIHTRQEVTKSTGDDLSLKLRPGMRHGTHRGRPRGGSRKKRNTVRAWFRSKKHTRLFKEAHGAVHS